MSVVVDRSSSASANLRWVGPGVMLAGMRGIVTWPAVVGLMTEAHACGVLLNMRALIVDYRPAVLAMSAAEMSAIQPSGVLSPLAGPIALVANEIDMPALRAHSEAMARRGMWRRTFLDTLTAYEWLECVLSGRSILDPCA